MTNGQYAITGGFWGLLVAIQIVGAPTLSIVPVGGGQVQIAWTPASAGFVLQETWSLTPANWTNSVSGAANPTVIPALQPMKFYRLFKP